MKLIYLILFCQLISFLSYSQTKTTISAIKSRNGILSDSVIIKGYIICENEPILIDDVRNYLKNAFIPESSYIRIEGELKNEIMENKKKYFGVEIQIIGRIMRMESFNKNFLDSTGVSNLVINSNMKNFKVLKKSRIQKSESVNIIRPESTNSPDLKECNKFALLYSGGINSINAHNRYYYDLEFMYSTLKYKYGYRDENIIVVYKDGKALNTNMLIDYPATSDGLNSAFKQLDINMKDSRDLFLFVTNHGGGYSSSETRNYGGINDINNDEVDNFHLDETIYFYNQYPIIILDDYFSTKINDLKLDNLVAVLEPCFSGGFIWDLKGKNRVLISAANEFEPSWASNFDSNFDEFAYLFTSALNQAFPNGKYVNSDINSDGVVSIYEAFLFAKKNDKANEHPMLDDNGDGIYNEQDSYYSSTLTLKSCGSFRIDRLSQNN